MEKKTIFILEDDQSFAIVFKRWLEDAGYRVITAETVAEAEKKLTEEPPALFWIDYYLKEDKNGMDFFRWLKKQPRFADVPAILVSVTVDMKKLKEFEKEGITKTFSKNITSRDTLLDGVKEILRNF